MILMFSSAELVIDQYYQSMEYKLVSGPAEQDVVAAGLSVLLLFRSGRNERSSKLLEHCFARSSCP